MVRYTEMSSIVGSEVLLYPTKEGCGSDSVGEYPIREVVDLTV